MDSKECLDIKVVISDLPGGTPLLEDFYVELVNHLISYLETKRNKFEVKYVNNFTDLHSEFECDSHKLVWFSNFPPNSTYEEYDVVESKRNIDGFIQTVPADSYSNSKLAFTEILAKYPKIVLEVITGAPFSVVSNFEIMALSAEGRVFIQRKHEWMNNNFHQSFANYVLTSLNRHINNNANPFDRIGIYQKKFTRTKVLYFEDDGNFSDEVISRLDRESGQMAFNAFRVESLQSLHKALLDKFPDIVVFIDVSGNHYDFIKEIAGNSECEFIVITGSYTEIPHVDNVTVVHMEHKKHYHISFLLEKIHEIASMDNTQNTPEHYLSKYYELLSDKTKNSFNDANRYIVGSQHHLIESVKAHKNFSIFAPAGTIDEVSRYINMLSVLSPYSILTYTPNEQFDQRTGAGELIEIQKLWDLPGNQMSFLAPNRLAQLIEANSELLNAANIQFFPTPSLSAFNESDWDKIGIKGRDAINSNGWHALSDPLAAFPAASLNAHFSFEENPLMTVLDSELSKILSLEIPYIDSSDPVELSKLIRDERESLSAFHIHTSRILDECINSAGDTSIDRILRRFEREINEGVRELESNIKRLKRTNLITLTSGTVLTASFTVMSVYGLVIPQSIAAFAGSGGAIGVLGNALSYLNELQNKKNNEFYFFWKLKHKGK